MYTDSLEMEKGTFCNIEFQSFFGQETVLAVPEAKVQDMVRLYCNGTRFWVFRGKKYELSDNSAILIYSIKEEFLTGSGDESAVLKGLIQFEGKLGLIGEVVSDLYFTGSFGENKFGPLMKESQAQETVSSPSSVSNANYYMQNITKKSIFISHASADKEIATSFVDNFLRIGLDISIGEIFYTSSVSMGIQSGDKWKDSIRDHLMPASIIFCLVSRTYLKRQYCVAEMGIAWTLPGATVFPIIVPPFGKIGGGDVLGHLQYFRADEKERLAQVGQNLIDKGLAKRSDLAELFRGINLFTDSVAKATTAVRSPRKK